MNADQKQGWIQGIAWAVGQLSAAHMHGDLAEYLVKDSGLDRDDFKQAMKYDLDQMRTSQELREMLKDVTGIDDN